MHQQMAWECYFSRLPPWSSFSCMVALQWFLPPLFICLIPPFFPKSFSFSGFSRKKRLRLEETAGGYLVAKFPPRKVMHEACRYTKNLRALSSLLEVCNPERFPRPRPADVGFLRVPGERWTLLRYLGWRLCSGGREVSIKELNWVGDCDEYRGTRLSFTVGLLESWTGQARDVISWLFLVPTFRIRHLQHHY